MKRYMRCSLGWMLVLLMVLTTGCLHSRSTVEKDPSDSDVAMDIDPSERATQLQSGFIAAAAGDESGWDNTVLPEESTQPYSWRADELLVGQIAGVQVHRHPGGGVSVRMRGPSSFLGSNEPLYVVDGMPMLHVPDGVLMDINPYDIKRIEVLKDVDAKAVYGARGANGVVLITTKHGQ